MIRLSDMDIIHYGEIPKTLVKVSGLLAVIAAIAVQYVPVHVL